MAAFISGLVNALTVELIPLCAKIFAAFVNGKGLDFSELTALFEKIGGMF